MKKNCSKCGNEFECKVDEIQNCHCQKVKITKEKLIQLGKEYSDCLCEVCLKEEVSD